MNGLQGKKPAGRQWNRCIDAVVKIIRHKKIIIDNEIYIKLLSNGEVTYLTVSTDDVLNTTYNGTAFNELNKGF